MIPQWDSWKLHCPGALTYNLKRGAKYNWNYRTTPQRHMDGRRIECPRGKALGGSSSINAMVYVRGHPFDYDRWEQDDGCAGWGYAACLPYFRRAQRHELGGDAPVEILQRKHFFFSGRTRCIAPSYGPDHSFLLSAPRFLLTGTAAARAPCACRAARR